MLTEPDAKLMRTARHGHQVAYNAQTVVDADNKLIVAFDLINDGNDQRQLHPMAMQGRQALGVEQATVWLWLDRVIEWRAWTTLRG